MLIEQIIDFRLKWPEPPCRTSTPTTGYFHDKIYICMKNHLVEYYFLRKYRKRQCTLTWAKSFTKFDPKVQDFKRVVDLNCK